MSKPSAANEMQFDDLKAPLASNIEVPLSFQLLSVPVVDLYGYEADGKLTEEGRDRNPS